MIRKSISLRALSPHMDTLSRLDLVRRAGYQGVEVNLEPGQDYTLEASPEDLAQLRREVEARGLSVSSVYSRQQWSFPITSSSGDTRQRGEDILKRLARAAVILESEIVLVVPGAVDNSLFAAQPEVVPYEAAYERAQESLRKIVREDLAQTEVCLALENTWNKFLLSPLEFRRFVDEIGSSQVGVCLDVGNVLRTGFPEQWLRLLGRRVRHVHFKDFRLAVGNFGGFVNLLEGDVNWPAVRQALIEIGYDAWVVAEVLPHYQYHAERLVYETSASIDAILAGPAP